MIKDHGKRFTKPPTDILRCGLPLCDMKAASEMKWMSGLGATFYETLLRQCLLDGKHLHFTLKHTKTDNSVSYIFWLRSSKIPRSQYLNFPILIFSTKPVTFKFHPFIHFPLLPQSHLFLKEIWQRKKKQKNISHEKCLFPCSVSRAHQFKYSQNEASSL